MVDDRIHLSKRFLTYENGGNEFLKTNADFNVDACKKMLQRKRVLFTSTSADSPTHDRK